MYANWFAFSDRLPLRRALTAVPISPAGLIFTFALGFDLRVVFDLPAIFSQYRFIPSLTRWLDEIFPALPRRVFSA